MLFTTSLDMIEMETIELPILKWLTSYWNSTVDKWLFKEDILKITTLEDQIE